MKKILFSASTEMLSDNNRDEVMHNCDLISILDFVQLSSLNRGEKYKIWVVHPCPNFVIDNSILEFLPNLEFVITPTTGTTHIDVFGLEEKGIKVIGLKGSSVVNQIKASSEFTFIHILNVLRKFTKSVDHVKRGNWRVGDSALRGHEVCESVVGIVGLGRIGGNIAKWLNCMGAKVIYYDPFVEDENFIRVHTLTDMLSSLDVLVVCVHLNNETKGMINIDILKDMKPNSWLVNTSRGEVIVEEDLIFALTNGIIKGASIDVVCGENDHDLLINNRLFNFANNFPNLIITPHVAGLTFESESKAQMFAFKEAIKYS